MCPPLLVAAVVAAGVAVAAGVTAKAIGDAQSRGDYAEAMRLRQEAAAKYGSIILPKIDAIVANTLGPTELSKIQGDTEGRQAQLDALQQYKGLLGGGGADAQTRLADMQAQSEAGRLSGGMQASMQQDLAQRGMTGGGYYASGMQNAAQAGAQQGAMMQAQAAADKNQRYASALGAYGQLGGQIRGQDYDQAAQRAAAQDAINRWNAQNGQDIARYNNTVRQSGFDNQLALANAQSNAANGLANAYTGEAQRIQGNANSYGQLIGDEANMVGGSLAKYYGSQGQNQNQSNNEAQPQQYIPVSNVASLGYRQR